jgi:Flp pilus assembly protein TadG
MSQSAQYALVFPALMLSTLGVIQAGVWISGRQVIAAAANAGADAGRSAGSDEAAGRAAAMRVAGRGGLTDVVVSIRPGPTRLTVTVSGTIPMFFDLGLARVSETASAPMERVTSP